MVIISVDPGNGTGMDFYMRHPNGTVSRFSYEVYGLLEVVDQLRLWNSVSKGWTDPIHLAVEQYVMTGGGGVKTPQPLALKIMGVTELLAADFGWKHHYYQVNDCKRTCDNFTLRRLGWWQPTKDGHINDARRVTLTCMKYTFPEEFAGLLGI